MSSPFVRDPSNPILTADAFDDPSVILVFNPGVAEFDGRLVMAVRLDHGRPGDSNTDGSSVAFVASHDRGQTWHVGAFPTIDRDRAIAVLGPAEPHRDLHTELWSVYDPRLTVLRLPTESGAAVPHLALSIAVDTTHGLRPGLLTSADGHAWVCRHLGPPDDRNHTLFPEPVDGAWWRLTRPMHDYGGAALNATRHEIWAQRSPDLVHWGGDRMVADPTMFDAAAIKIGPGAPPIRTAAGWLAFVHVVTEVDAALADAGQRGWEPRWDRHYSTSAILLDEHDPSRIRAIAPAPLLEPTADYERLGYRNDVVFGTGCIVRRGNEAADTAGASAARPQSSGDMVELYYGAADTVVARASAPLDDVVEFVLGGHWFD